MRAVRGKKYTWSEELGKLVEVERETPRDVDAPAPLQDSMEPMQSMADCKFYDSKSKYRQSLRDLGYIEVGNDVDGFKPKNPFETRQYQEQLKEDLTRSYYECRDKMAPVSEYERSRFTRMDRDRQRSDYDRRDRDRTGRTRD